MRIPSHMNHNFSQVPEAEIPRSQFVRNCGLKTTFNSGWIVPIFVDEALPGDTFNLHMTGFARLATPLHPFMDNLFMDTFFFAVPNRLVWDNWQKFNGEQRNPGDSTDFLVPQMTSPAGGYVPPTDWSAPTTAQLSGALSDYFTLPTRVAGVAHSALWHRAYNLIYNEWFRDENLQNSVVVDLDDGPDDPNDYLLKRRGKRHDYFTSALPWPQKGPAVPLPLTGNAPVKSPYGSGANSTIIVNQVAGPDIQKVYVNTSTVAASGFYADLSAVAAATINSIRQAFQIQKLYERDARGGTRYTEILRVTSALHRLTLAYNAPNISAAVLPLSTLILSLKHLLLLVNLPRRAISLVWVLHISMVMASSNPSLNTALSSASFLFVQTLLIKTVYTVCSPVALVSTSTGLPFLISASKLSLIKKFMLQGSANPTADAAAFGYQERYAEYRYKPSAITGKFRSNDPQTLDSWHLAQKFTSLPLLNDTFIQDNPPVSRVIAVPSEPEFLFDSYFNLLTARPMPVYSVPGLIDHF